MTLLKLLSSLTIIISSSLLGVYYSKFYIDRVNNLIHFQHCIQILETEILYAANPLPEALKEVYKKGNKKVSFVFNEISKHLINSRNSNVYDGFINVVSILKDDFCFKEQDIEIILSFGRNLGASNRVDQEKYFKMVLLQLSNQQKEAELEKVKSVRMYKSLGVLIGFGIVLALY